MIVKEWKMDNHSLYFWTDIDNISCREAFRCLSMDEEEWKSINKKYIDRAIKNHYPVFGDKECKGVSGMMPRSFINKLDNEGKLQNVK